jgi:hypothetical protein
MVEADSDKAKTKATYFDAYWARYPSTREREDRGKLRWSTRTRRLGIVRTAVESLAMVLTKGQAIKATRSTPGVWLCDRVLHHGAIRMHLMGVESGYQTLEVVALLRERCRDAVCMCVVPDAREAIWPLLDEPDLVGAATLIPLYPMDMDALARADISVMHAIEYKLIRRLVFDNPDQATQLHDQLLADYKVARLSVKSSYTRPLKDVISDRSDDFRQMIPHPELESVVGNLQREFDCLLSGASSSGKTVLGLEAAERLLLNGNSARYINLGTTKSPPVGLVDELWANPAEYPHLSLTVIDDLQSNPQLARYVLACSDAAKRVCEPGAVHLAICWADYASEAMAWFAGARHFGLKSGQLAPALVARYAGEITRERLDRIVSLVGDDLLLLGLVLEQAKSSGVANLGEVAAHIWRLRTDGAEIPDAEMRRIGLVTGSLGRYDIATPIQFLVHEADASEQSVQVLIATGLLRRRADLVLLGHRSLCALLADWLEEEGAWADLEERHSVGDPLQVVHDYLRSLSPGDTVAALRALQARAGFRSTSHMNRRATALASIWSAFNAVAERIEQQQSTDPTWGTNPASAMFSTAALIETGKAQQAKASLEFLRRHWHLDAGEFRIDARDLSTADDFDEIGKRMADEDHLLPALQPGQQSASRIDVSRFHSTWVMGLILCAEGATDGNYVPLDVLACAAESAALPNGAFYPERVPWCSARVLIGLAACGRRESSSGAVRKAVDWMLSSADEGGAQREGVWHSGTGSWNTQLETTCMVLVALAAVGHDLSDSRMRTAREFVESQRFQWTAPGYEVDGAFAIQAFLDTGGEWARVVPEAQQLAQWVQAEALWRGLTRSSKESLQQSCTVAQIASQLINIGWTAIRSDLPDFLNALAPPHSFHAEFGHTSVVPPQAVVTEAADALSTRVTARSGDATVAWLSDLHSIDLSQFTVIGSYRRFDPRQRTQLRDWAKRIAGQLNSGGKKVTSFLIWAAPGSGKTFFVRELYGTYGGSAKYSELNLGETSKTEFRTDLRKAARVDAPLFCVIDEVDSLSEETWPYEILLPNVSPDSTAIHPRVYILIGSTPPGLEALMARMRARAKGADLLDRIPSNQHFTMPEATSQDRAITFVNAALSAAAGRVERLTEVELFVLFFVMKTQEWRSPRQIAELARQAVGRLNPGDSGLRFHHLFEGIDYRRGAEFFASNKAASEALGGILIPVCI